MLEAWLSDVAPPSPEALRYLILILRDTQGAEAEKSAFARVLNTPSSKVTPHDRRMHPSPGTYSIGSLRDSLAAALTALPFAEQERLIVRWIREVREVAASEPPKDDLG